MTDQMDDLLNYQKIMCENTISAGFQFMLGKFLFDLTIFGVVFLGFAAFWGFVVWSNRRR